MSVLKNKIFYWLPRVFGIAIALFLSLFALDAFESGFSWPALGAYVIHLVPTFIVLMAVLIGWFWEGYGSIIFALFGIAYILMAWGSFHWSAYVLIAGPMFLESIFMLISWKRKHVLHEL